MHDINPVQISNTEPETNEPNDQIAVVGDRWGVTIAGGDQKVTIRGKKAIGEVLTAIAGTFGLPTQSAVARTVESAVNAIASVEDAHARAGGGGPPHRLPSRNVGIGASQR